MKPEIDLAVWLDALGYYRLYPVSFPLSSFCSQYPPSPSFKLSSCIFCIKLISVFNVLFHFIPFLLIRLPFLSTTVLSQPFLSHPVLPNPFLSYFSILSRPIPTYPFPSSSALSFPFLFFYPVLSYSYISYPELYTVLSCPMLSYPLLFCPILTYSALIYPILFL